MKKYVIIVAGGAGKRMNSAIPKQFLLLADKPVLMHTIEKFYSCDSNMQIIVVLPGEQIDFWKTLCTKYKFTVPHRCTAGGASRFHSVKNGLKHVEIPSLVAIHDGVRPLVSVETVARCFDAAAKFGAAIPVINPVNSMRQVIDNKNIAVNRNEYRIVQTPQVFSAQLIKNAYLHDFDEKFTDDASVAETAGAEIYLVRGNSENIKITSGADLEICETLLKNRN